MRPHALACIIPGLVALSTWARLHLANRAIGSQRDPAQYMRTTRSMTEHAAQEVWGLLHPGRHYGLAAGLVAMSGPPLCTVLATFVVQPYVTDG